MSIVATGLPSRASAIMAAVEAAQRDMLPGDDPAMVVCCLGAPGCPHGGDDVPTEVMDRCGSCSRITVGEELPRA